MQTRLFARPIGWLLIAICLFPSPLSAMAQRRARPAGTPAASSPTLGETAAWLKRTIEALPATNYRLADVMAMDVQYPTLEIAGCQLTVDITQTIYGKVGNEMKKIGGEVRTRVTVPLKDIDAGHIVAVEEHPEAGFFRIEVNTVGGQKTIRVGSLSSDQAEESTLRANFFFYVEKKELAERVAKALAHAVELCGGKSEPF